MKALFYRLYSIFRKVCWHARGHRGKVMFGMEVKFVPEAEFSESIGTLLLRLGLKRIDLLIMDIEGAEVRVLPAIPWDEVEIKCIYCEMHPGEWNRFAADGTEIERVIREQSLICLDMYLNPFATFKANHYAGPAVMFRHTDNR